MPSQNWGITKPIVESCPVTAEKTRFPRRTSILCAHIRKPADSAVLDRHTAHAASTSSHRARPFPLFVILPRCRFSPELISRGTSPR